MFGGRSEVSHENDKSGDEENGPLEEVKHIAHDSLTSNDVP